MRRQALGALVMLACCGPAAVDPARALLGGDTTIFDDGDEAFNYPLHNLSDDKRGAFQIGDGVFNRNWLAAPATPQGNDGLGPTYNAKSCSGCHTDNGRGAPPADASEPFLGLLLRLSVPGTDAHGGPLPDPSYGDQLNQYAILGVPPEATPTVSYTELPGSYADGQPYSLRMPSYGVTTLQFGPLAPGIRIAPRLAPQVIGLGLLEAVSEDTIRELAAKNGGRPNQVWDTAKQQMVLGRFGWKANQPNLAQQTFAAFRNDIGITSTLYPAKNCPSIQSQCASAPFSLTLPNLDPIKADGMVVHSLGLAVPARRGLDDAQALHGEEVFSQIGCAVCHIATLQTGTLAGWPELSNQTIHPYTDLLLHDMGAQLADGRPDYLASGSEWRTPPLWGLGLAEQINDYLYLMHDGRARGFEEAILWHDGAGSMARDAFRSLPADDRRALVAFLKSL